MRRIGLLCVVSAMLAGRGLAQFGGAPKIDPATVGTVTGHVTFAENRLPARFANVILVRRPDPEDLMPDFSSDVPTKRAAKPTVEPPEKVVLIGGRSGFDGSYTIAEVPPGDYYAIAKMEGYVVPIRTPANEKEARDIDKMAADLPLVHVEVARTSMMDVALHRGGAISGRVQFKDGSPVVGMKVRADLADAPDEQMWGMLPYMPLAAAVSNPGSGMEMGGRSQLTTDDEGRFRISGLAPGKYRVSTVLQMGGGTREVSRGPHSLGSTGNGDQGTTLTVYGPGVMRKAQGKVLEIKGDERFSDANIDVDLNGLHTVRGRVLAKEDSHAPNVVFLALTDDAEKDDKAMRFGMPRMVMPDGSFVIENIAPGTYTLRAEAEDIEEISPEKQVEMAKQAQAGTGEMMGPKTLKRYGSVKVTVIVAEHDVTVDDILLTESTDKIEDEAAPQ